MLKILKDSKWNINGEEMSFKKGQIIKDNDVPIFIYNDMINNGLAEGYDAKKSIKDYENKSLKEKDIENKSVKSKRTRGRPKRR